MTTPRTDRRRPIFARVYPLMARGMERGGMTERRRDLLDGLHGQVLEVGPGDGADFPHYPAEVEQVLAVEPEPWLRALAAHAAATAPVPVTVQAGTAEHLPAETGSMDAVVFAMVLCSLPDQAAALAEAKRVLKPAGQIRFLEHVRADTPGLVRIQRALDATIWPHLVGGCHLSRDTVTAIRNAGFIVGDVQRFLFPEARTPASFHILGTATLPSD